MSGGPTTRIADVVDELVDLVKAAAPDLDVADGPQIGEVLSDAICVGFTDGPDSPGYDTTTAPAGGMGGRHREDWTVRCFLTVAAPDDDLRALRRRAAGYIAAIDAALLSTRRKPGAWDRAAIAGGADWIPLLTEHGGLCNVLFSVEGSSLL